MMSRALERKQASMRLKRKLKNKYLDKLLKRIEYLPANNNCKIVKQKSAEWLRE